jgi:hypothetical protein
VFSGLCQKFPQATDEVKNFFCHFPSPWVLRMSGMVGYGQKCEKMPKSLHLNVHSTASKSLHKFSFKKSIQERKCFSEKEEKK